MAFLRTIFGSVPPESPRGEPVLTEVDLVDEDDDEEDGDNYGSAGADKYDNSTVDVGKMMLHFVDSMKAGIILIKHGKQGDPHRRKLLIDDDVTCVSWKKENGKNAKDRNSYPISGIKEIRWACEEDQSSAEDDIYGRLAGTPILRNSCRWEDAPMAFSIIWEERSLDLQCHTRLECKYLIHCFRQLVEDNKNGTGLAYRQKGSAKTSPVSVEVA
eukprot:FR736512.1.p1 GENE.FR736512.1~~FR736512.1.p1  ORF type:complete len:215 (+),score=18.76 FR736512.1:73-717(+)